MAAISAVFFLWQLPVVLVGVILLLATVKRYLIPIQLELLTYVLSGILGAVGESLIIRSGTWQYAQTHLFNIPLWLPFLWGLAGVTGVAFYKGISQDQR